MTHHGLALCLLFAASLTPAMENHYQTLGPMAHPIPGVSTETVVLSVDAMEPLGLFAPLQGEISQGAETGDPFFFEEIERELAALKPNLIRVALAASIDEVVWLDEDGNLEIDFSWADRIVRSLRATGTEICWNHADWPQDWCDRDGYPDNLEHWAEFTRRFIERYNGQGERNIHYVEFWNEPPDFRRDVYTAMAHAIKEVDPEVKVGGPSVLDLHFSAIEQTMLARGEGVPVDFISYHLYYRRPWDYPVDIQKAKDFLAQFPGGDEIEHLITEWGVDMAHSGLCDTRYNAVYFLTSQQEMMPHWPQVRPMHFELREGWDWKGPSRDLFGGWGMLTYSNQLPKPVYQAALMWAWMAQEQVAAHSSRDDIRVLASRDETQVTVLAWSFPREHAGNQPNDPVHGPPKLDTPVRLTIPLLPFHEPTGVQFERYVLDHVRGNVNAYPGAGQLEMVQQAVLAYPTEDASPTLTLDAVIGTHTAHLWIIRPAERAPADVEIVADRYQIWAGQSAEVTITPRHGDDFPVRLLEPPLGNPEWTVETLDESPLRLRLTPNAPGLQAARYFTAWIERPDWGAWGRALAEFRTANPVRIERDAWRTDAHPPRRSATTEVTLHNIANDAFEGELTIRGRPPLEHAPKPIAVRIGAEGAHTLTHTIPVPKDIPPGAYEVEGTLSANGVQLEQFTTTVHQPLAARRLKQAPEIDGNLDEWRGHPPLIIEGQENWGGHHLSPYEGDEDIRALVWAGWDETYLYFALEVTDATHYAPVHGREMYKYDCVHLGFDLRRDMYDDTLFFEEDDCDYLFAYTDRGVAYRHWGARRPEEVPEKVLIGAQRTDDGRTLYEIALPWEEEFSPHAGPVAGSMIGLSIYIRDFDHDEEEVEGGHLMWGRGLHWHVKRPALFNALYLEK